MKQHSIQLVFLLIFLIEFGKALKNSEQRCITPFKRAGLCIDAQKCLPVYNLMITNTKLSRYQDEFLRNSRCDLTNALKVCCQLNTTPTPPTVDRPPIPKRPARPMKYQTSSNLLPQPPYCGISDTVPLGSRIIGGKATQIYEFPWMVLIEYTFPDSGQKYLDCGGVLINHHYVLTAAHCANDKTSGVRLGEWNQTTNPDNQGAFRADPFLDVRVVDVIPHEFYDSHSLANDIALLRLEKPVNYTKSIKPICLPSAVGMVNKIFDNIGLTVAGFGQTESDIVSSIKLMVNIEGFPQDKCQRLYRSLTLNQLCAGGKADQDSCNGDSGGPLMWTPNNSNHTYLVGLVSYGPTPCGQVDLPGVYTRVSKYLSWIYTNVLP
ncbi:serine protease easter-like [Contarinia nasturtii]|uniref:serine protease easter-like n=1 Tax=Contarinia nasturtii TaxID=265458 RepID=UPI0012D39C7B|nr:serine protease easter-like [Contarinia nasturtii]